MWITRVSIKNPVFATMVMVGITMLGVFAYNRLRVEQRGVERANRGVRLPKLIAHESEQCGPSGQVVSRYWLEVPRFQRKRTARERALVDATGQLGAVLSHASAPRRAVHEWAREIASESIVYAAHAVQLVTRSAAALAHVPELLMPLLSHAPPPTA